MKRTLRVLCKASQSSAVERTSGGRVVKKRELRWERACGAAPQRPRHGTVAAAAAAAPNHHHYDIPRQAMLIVVVSATPF